MEPKSETRVCQNCQRQFEIDASDFLFYEKIKVPPPTWCPECRRQRRLSWRNDFTFYNRSCDLCKKLIVSLYAPNSPRKRVYCNKCWWSDKWDPKSYGQDIDFSKSFFEQFRELQNKVPLIALVNDDGIGSVNCEYTQNVSLARNCYMVSMSWKNEDCLYCYSISGPELKDAVDSNGIFQNCQIIYDSIFLEKCYKCRNIYYSAEVVDSAFSYDLRGCKNCFLCIGLRNKQYYIKNKPYPKEEYEKILASYKIDTWSGTRRTWLEFLELIKKYPHRFANLRNCVNSTGDELFDCRNVKYSFTARGCEDTKYFESGNLIKDSYDLSTGGESNQCYEGLTADNDYRALFTIFSWKNVEVLYCENCHSSKYLFGCSGLRSGEYCILNKQYSKEEYGTLKEKLIEHMEKTGEWGEFFPSRLSPFGYNETIAQIYFPLNKEDARAKGYNWQDSVQITVGKETLKPEDIPDSIHDISDSIVNEVLACISCRRNYRIIPQEFSFYQTMAIPIPRLCFYCRNQARFNFRNPYKLWHRKCTCGGRASENGVYQNQTAHFHGASHCINEFETSYAPERPEIVYCEQCYQNEVI